MRGSFSLALRASTELSRLPLAPESSALNDTSPLDDNSVLPHVASSAVRLPPQPGPPAPVRDTCNSSPADFAPTVGASEDGEPVFKRARTISPKSSPVIPTGTVFSSENITRANPTRPASMTGGSPTLESNKMTDEGSLKLNVVELPPGWSIKRYTEQGCHKMAMLVVGYKYRGSDPDKWKPEQKAALAFVKPFLVWLEHVVDITPALRNPLEGVLQKMMDPEHKVSSELVQTCERVHRKFIDSNWGAEEVVDDADEPIDDELDSGDDGAQHAGNMDNDTVIENTVVSLRPPPRNHPVWGHHPVSGKGIMYGMARKQGSKKWTTNPALLHEKRSCNVFGHNDLAPGDWWPFQRLAMFNGAHGQTIKGISGNVDKGAYSIVVKDSSKYGHDELDVDRGEELWYSADGGSISNTNRNAIASLSSGTRALQKSIETKRPVRVLRSVGVGPKSTKPLYPSCGIRYDGLYEVTDVKTSTNSQGGLYRRFRLRRCPDQVSLDQVQRAPSLQQRADFERIREGY